MLSVYFFCVGLIFFCSSQATWQRVECWIKVQKLERVDLVDFGPPDRDQTHVLNSELSIALVKSNSCDLISQSANCGVTHDCLWMLR